MFYKLKIFLPWKLFVQLQNTSTPLKIKHCPLFAHKFVEQNWSAAGLIDVVMSDVSQLIPEINLYDIFG